MTEVSHLGYVYGTMAALKRMKRRNRGAIVQVGSALAYRGKPAAECLLRCQARQPGFNEALRCQLPQEKSNVQVSIPTMRCCGFALQRLRRSRRRTFASTSGGSNRRPAIAAGSRRPASSSAPRISCCRD